ncbi:MAG: hypothetical protein AAGC67_09805 [Myxococcota bacterium]
MSRPTRPHPFEDVGERAPLEPERPTFAIDLRRCIGCHACSVACKTAHDVPLGVFPLRVRWLPRPDDSGHAFVPVFAESICGDDPDSRAVGMEPACVRACPTDALRFGEEEEATSAGATQILEGPDATDLKKNVRYRGLPDWVSGKLNRGAELDPRDEDPIYEQR